MAGNVKRLTKSNEDSFIAGVCGGIGEYIGIDPMAVRVGFVIGSFFSGGGLVVGYIILSVLMPSANSRGNVGEDRRTVSVPVDGKRKNDDDVLHHARPIKDLEEIRDKLKRDE